MKKTLKTKSIHGMEKKVKYEANIFCLALKSVGIEVKDGGSDGVSLLELGHHAGP